MKELTKKKVIENKNNFELRGERTLLRRAPSLQAASMFSLKDNAYADRLD